MVRKCRRIAEITVMEVAEVGVRTRAQAAMEIDDAERSTSTKRRKVGNGKSTVFLTPDCQLRHRKRLVNAISDQAAASCCSSNCSGEMEAVNAEVEISIYYDGDERREAAATGQISPENTSNKIEPTVGQTDGTCRRGLIPSKTPSESEIEEFFSSVEEDLRKRFAEKYNYDILKDEALEGRYEWARVKP